MSNIKIGENETFEEYKKRTANQSNSTIETRGRKKNTGKLSQETQLKIIDLIKHRPSFYNIKEQPFWSPKSIQQLIQLKMNKELALSTIRDYLNKWFNIKQIKKGNQIKNLLNNDDILRDSYNDNTTILYVKTYINGFIHIVTRLNENKFIYCGNKNQKNLIKTYKYLISCYKDENIYLIFDSFFYDKTIFNKLLNRNLKIFYIKNTFKDQLINKGNSLLVKEFKKETSKPIKNKETNENKIFKIEKFDEVQNFLVEEEFDEVQNFLVEEEFDEVDSFIVEKELDLNNIKI